MTTPTPKDDAKGESQTETPGPETDRDVIEVTTEDDVAALARARERDDSDAQSSVVTSDVAEESEPESDAGTGDQAKADADGPSDGKSQKATPDASTETASGEDAGGAGKDDGEGDGDGQTEKPGRRARKMRRLQAENEELRARLDQLEAKVNEAGSDAGATEKPQPDDFDDWEKYAEALADWKVAEMQRASGAGDAPPAEEKRAAPESWEEFADEHADFWDVVSDEDIPISDVMVDTVIAMDGEGAELLYELCKNNPEEAKRIARLSDQVAVARELGRAQERLSGAAGNGQGKAQPGGSNGTGKSKAADAPKVSSAPEPISDPAGGGSSGGRERPLHEETDPDAYRRRREAMSDRGGL